MGAAPTGLGRYPSIPPSQLERPSLEPQPFPDPTLSLPLPQKAAQAGVGEGGVTGRKGVQGKGHPSGTWGQTHIWGYSIQAPLSPKEKSCRHIIRNSKSQCASNLLRTVNLVRVLFLVQLGPLGWELRSKRGRPRRGSSNFQQDSVRIRWRSGQNPFETPCSHVFSEVKGVPRQC